MKKGLIFAAGLLLGAGAGGYGAFFLTKQHLDQRNEEEIASVRESFRRELSARKEERKELAEKYQKAMEAMAKYAGEAPEEKEPKKPDPPKPQKRPYLITPMQFAETDKKYEDVTLRYYPDGPVTDVNDNSLTMDQIDRLVGRESLSCFGENGQEEDSVCVRNEELGKDFQILMMEGSWAEVVRAKAKEKPHQAG